MTVKQRKEILLQKFDEADYHIGDCIKWLESIGYFEAPAAKSHHGNYPGGLFNHSLEVASQLQEITKKMGLTWQRKGSPILVGMLHDICKADDYVVEGTENGKVEYAYNKQGIMSGHGDKSVIMLAGHFQLTDEEVMCIRFHMGAFTDKEEWQYYSKAVHDYPNVLWTHTADMLASQVVGI